MTVLRTRNLTLSPCSPLDRSDFISLELDPEVMHFLNGGAVDHATNRPENVTFLMPRGSETYVWTARRTDIDVFIGWFCLFPETSTLAEIGYRLRREHWGQGLATEGATALVTCGFDSAGYAKVDACTMAVNHASRRVLEKIGMQHIRTEFPSFHSRIPGAAGGEVWYELSRSEWNSNKC